MKNLNFLVAAYVAIWAVFCVFLFSVAQRVARLQDDIRKLNDSARREPSRAQGVEKVSTAR